MITALTETPAEDRACFNVSESLAIELPTLPGMHSLESTSEENDQNAFGHFKNSRLPEFLRGSLENAKKIINLKGIGPHPPVL